MTWTAVAAITRRFWWTVPIAGLLAALLVTRATLADRTQTLTNERQAWTAEVDRAQVVQAQAEARYATGVADAANAYADRLDARAPIILRSTDTVRDYAKTDAGRVLCRTADRVRAIDALDAELAEDPRTAGSGDGTVRPDDATSPAGR